MINRLLRVPEYEVHDDIESFVRPRTLAGRDTTESGASIRKAKKGRRKPLPKKIRDKNKEKREKQKIQKEKRVQQKGDVQICKIEGQNYVKRRPIPDVSFSGSCQT